MPLLVQALDGWRQYGRCKWRWTTGRDVNYGIVQKAIIRSKKIYVFWAHWLRNPFVTSAVTPHDWIPAYLPLWANWLEERSLDYETLALVDRSMKLDFFSGNSSCFKWFSRLKSTDVLLETTDCPGLQVCLPDPNTWRNTVWPWYSRAKKYCLTL